MDKRHLGQRREAVSKYIRRAIFTGELNRQGDFNVVVNASDDIGNTQTQFSWTVTDNDGTFIAANEKSGLIGSTDRPFLLLLISVVLLRMLFRGFSRPTIEH